MTPLKKESKHDWTLINSVLQWSFLLSTVIYLAIARNGTMKPFGELDERILRNEKLLKGNEIRIKLLENTERRNSHKDEITRKDFLQKVFDGKNLFKLKVF